ncbi:MAG: regulatory protein GemA [Methylovulum sp.]|nr:regulatory protein GemA [Methylovulum sp.]
MPKPYSRMSETHRKAAISKIHIAKTQLGLSETHYRNILQDVGKAKSSKDLTVQGFDAVIKHLKGLGAEFTAPQRAGKKPHNLDSQAAKAKQLQKIGALLADMQLSWEYAAAIAQQMYKKQALEFCSGRELIGITTALVNKQKQVAK